MSFKVSEKRFESSDINNPVDWESLGSPEGDDPLKDGYKCVMTGEDAMGRFSSICAPVGKKGPFAGSNLSQAEKELFCDIVTMAMAEGQEVPDSWISTCRVLLNDE